MEQMGLLHLYYGDGKGKTTAVHWAAEKRWSSCSS